VSAPRLHADEITFDDDVVRALLNAARLDAVLTDDDR
jgi:hypothetical protein